MINLKSMRIVTLLLLLAVAMLQSVTANPVSDDALYDHVRIRLANDREIGGNPIDVKVTDGHVELTGKVKTEKQKTKAEKETKKVKGVKSVVNKITVAPV